MTNIFFSDDGSCIFFPPSNFLDFWVAVKAIPSFIGDSETLPERFYYWTTQSKDPTPPKDPSVAKFKDIRFGYEVVSFNNIHGRDVFMVQTSQETLNILAAFLKGEYRLPLIQGNARSLQSHTDIRRELNLIESSE
jgi:hypothetical protein